LPELRRICGITQTTAAMNTLLHNIKPPITEKSYATQKLKLKKKKKKKKKEFKEKESESHLQRINKANHRPENQTNESN
jgi:hypothetical protein